MNTDLGMTIEQVRKIAGAVIENALTELHKGCPRLRGPCVNDRCWGLDGASDRHAYAKRVAKDFLAADRFLRSRDCLFWLVRATCDLDPEQMHESLIAACDKMEQVRHRAQRVLSHVSHTAEAS